MRVFTLICWKIVFFFSLSYLIVYVYLIFLNICLYLFMCHVCLYFAKCDLYFVLLYICLYFVMNVSCVNVCLYYILFQYMSLLCYECVMRLSKCVSLLYLISMYIFTFSCCIHDFKLSCMCLFCPVWVCLNFCLVEYISLLCLVECILNFILFESKSLSCLEEHFTKNIVIPHMRIRSDILWFCWHYGTCRFPINYSSDFHRMCFCTSFILC